MSTNLSTGLIRAFPKVELHIHLEACISGERIEQRKHEVVTIRTAGEAELPLGERGALSAPAVQAVQPSR
mgnify:CR=1 FL=1